MRSLFIAVLILSWLPLVLFKPHIGILLWDWVSHMNPHRQTYGFAYNFQFLNFIAAATILGIILSKDKYRLPGHPILFAILAYFIWTLFTTIAGYDWALSVDKLIHLSKVLLFALLSVLVMRSPNRLKAFVYIMALSLAFVAVKGGVYTIFTGGTGRVQGAGGMIDDNNQLAMALAMMLPVALYFVKHPPLPWLKWPLLGVAASFAVSVLGTSSRGGLVALVAVVGVIILKSRRRFLYIAVMLPLAFGAYFVLPDSWKARMASIDQATEDSSFLGRVSMWKFAVNLTDEHPVEGGGFRVFEMAKPVERFMPVGYAPRAPHSIYFEVLGEHGYVGLVLFLTILFTGWFAGGASARRFRLYRETYWLGDLAEALQLGLVGYAVGGLTVNIATFDLFFHFLALLMMVDQVGQRLLEKGAVKLSEEEARQKVVAAKARQWVPANRRSPAADN